MLTLQKLPDYSQLTQDWFDASENDANTSKRIELDQNTEEATKYLEEMGMTEQAESFADIILQTVDTLGKEKSKKIKKNHEVKTKSKILAQWIGLNTGVREKLEGAYPVLLHLFQTVAKLKKYPNAFELNSDLCETPLASLALIKNRALKYVNDPAALYKDTEGRNLQDLHLPEDVMRLIFSRNHPPKTTITLTALERTFTAIQKHAIQAYRGSLIDLNIKNADQAIKFVEKYGPELIYINISNISFSENQLQQIAGYLTNLRGLFANNCNLNGERLKSIIDSKSMPNLKILSLSDNNIDDQDAIAIFKSDWKLQKLNLGNNKIGPKGAQAIPYSENMFELIGLYLANNQIGPEGAQAIAGATNMPKLKELNLCNNKIGPDGARAIAKSIYRSNLLELILNFNGIRSEGVNEIANSEYMKKLTMLVLDNNGIDLEGLKAVIHSTYLSQNLINSILKQGWCKRWVSNPAYLDNLSQI